MSERSDEALALAAQRGDGEAGCELGERHRGLLVTMLRQDFRVPSRAVFESLLRIGEQAYRDAVLTYEPSLRVPARRWMAKKARWAMVDAARAATRDARRRAAIEEMWPGWANNVLVESRIATLPDPRMRLLAAERLTPWIKNRPTQAELVAILDVGQQQISRLETRTRKLLRESNVAWRKSGEPVTAWPQSATSTDDGAKFTVRLRFEAEPPGIVKCFRAPCARTCEVQPIRARRVEPTEAVEMTDEEKEVMRRIYERAAA